MEVAILFAVLLLGAFVEHCSKAGGRNTTYTCYDDYIIMTYNFDDILPSWQYGAILADDGSGFLFKPNTLQCFVPAAVQTINFLFRGLPLLDALASGEVHEDMDD